MVISLLIMSVIVSCGLSGNLYEDGKKSFVNGNYEEAAAFYEAAIKENSERAEYYIEYGLSLIKLERYEEALSMFDKAYVNKNIIIVNRNNKRLYRGKGITYYHMQDYDKALEELRKALKINELPGMNMDILYYIGSSLMTIGSYEEATDIYTGLIKLDGKNAGAYNNRGLCYRSQGAFEQGVADYEAAIQLEPRNFSHYFGLYFLLMEQGDTTGAAEVLTKTSELTPKTGEDNYNLAKVHFYQGDYERALSELSDGYNNGFSEAYYYIGEIYRIKKDYPKAIYYYDIFIKDGEIMAPNVYNQIAACLIKTGEYAQALDYLENGIALNHAAAMKTLKKNEIVAYECMGAFDKAGEKLIQYRTDYPDDQEAAREARFVETRLIK